MAAAPQIGRATAVEPPRTPREAEATEALYERHARALFGFCVSRLGNREEAEDAVQSTFLNAFRGLQRGIVPETESAWLFKIAHNVCLSRRRSTWRRNRIEFANDLETLQEVTPAPPAATDELIPLADVLARMPENQRRAILLREWQGLSYREISEELELSQAAVETLIFRARRTLAQGLGAEQQAPVKLRRGVNVGSLLAGLKSLLVGGSAVKVAATVAAVSGVSIMAGGPLEHHFMRPPAQAAAPVARHVAKKHAPAVASPSSASSAAARPVVYRAAPVTRVAAPATAKPRVRHASAAHAAAPKHVAVRTHAPARVAAPAPAAPAPAAPVAQTPSPEPATVVQADAPSPAKRIAKQAAAARVASTQQVAVQSRRARKQDQRAAKRGAAPKAPRTVAMPAPAPTDEPQPEGDDQANQANVPELPDNVPPPPVPGP